MNPKKVLPIAILVLMSVATLSAQAVSVNPSDASCWSSLSALRACQQQQDTAAMEQAERCTSYPEFQCMPAEKPNTPNKNAAIHASKAKTQAADSKSNAGVTDAATEQPATNAGNR